MTDRPSERDPLEELAEDFMRRVRQGESPSVEAYASDHPELAADIRELFPTIAAVERLKTSSSSCPFAPADLPPVDLDRLGDFRIVREIGRGGMGIVYEAEQESLGRRVALKVLPRQSLLEVRHIERFRREAAIASRLHHTNIVQVYGVGEEVGYHFYVMQYVRGVGLDRVMDRLRSGLVDTPQTPEDDLAGRVVRQVPGWDAPAGGVTRQQAYIRFVVGLVVQAADALAYAHGQGTLHRDIKPANFLLDDRGVVWLADFGLASALDAPQVTRTGDLTGTLRYLAPERLAGQNDRRSDLYSLGLTLYELLTLKPAHCETDRPTLLRNLSHATPPPPRSLNPHLPRDLETVVLKAIAPEPRRRYTSADELGEDLRRFLEHRPVQARRIGPAGKLWRWCGRNRAVAALSAATFLLVLAVAVVAVAGYLRTRASLQRESRHRQRAEAVVNLAGEALDRMFDRLGPGRRIVPVADVDPVDAFDVPPGEPSPVSARTAELLEDMLPFYDRLAEHTGEDAALQRRAARARLRVGDIHQHLGQYPSAEDAYRDAIVLQEALLRADPDDAELRAALGQAWNELGRVRLAGRDPSAAMKAYRQAEQVLGYPGTADDRAIRYERARTYFLLGQRKPPRPGDRPARQPTPAQRDVGPRPVPGPMHFGRGPADDPDRERRNADLAKAIELLDGLLEADPDSPDCRYLLALCCREYVAPPGQSDRNTAGRAIELLEDLVEDYPRVPDYRYELCETYAAIETLRPGPDRQDLARGRLDKALRLGRDLRDRYPNVPAYAASLARVYFRLADLDRLNGCWESASGHFRAALDLQAGLAERFSNLPTYAVWEVVYRNALARTLLARGQPDEARDLFQQSLARLDRLAEQHPDLGNLQPLRARTHRFLADAFGREGTDEPARRHAQQADVLRESGFDEFRGESPGPPEE